MNLHVDNARTPGHLALWDVHCLQMTGTRAEVEAYIAKHHPSEPIDWRVDKAKPEPMRQQFADEAGEDMAKRFGL